MKYLLTCLFLFTLLSACKKNDDAPKETGIPLFDSLQKHTWILDSFRAVTAFDTSVSGLITEPRQSLAFKNSILTENYGSTSTQYKTEFQEPDSLFFWYPQSIKDPSLYFLINDVTNTKLTTSQHFGSDETTTNYYHAE